MKKRAFTLFTALILCLCLLTSTVLAVEYNPVPTAQPSTVGTTDATQKASGSQTDKAVSALQAQLDALPTADSLANADEAEIATAYQAAQDAYDALEALEEQSPEQLAQLTGLEKLTALMDWFNGQVAPLDQTTNTNQASLSYKASGAAILTTQAYSALKDALNAIESLPAGATDVEIKIFNTNSGSSEHTVLCTDDPYTLPTGTYTITNEPNASAKQVAFMNVSNNKYCNVVVPAGANITISGDSNSQNILIRAKKITVDGSLTLGKAKIDIWNDLSSGVSEPTPVEVTTGGALTTNSVACRIRGNVTVNGGTVVVNDGTVAINDDSTPNSITVNSGELKVETNSNSALGAITVNGGKVVVKPQSLTLNLQRMTQLNAVTVNDGTVEISYGIFNELILKNGGTVKISHGTFKKGVKTTVSGDTVGSMLSENYAFLQNENGSSLWYDKDSTEANLENKELAVHLVPINSSTIGYVNGYNDEDLVSGDTVELRVNSDYNVGYGQFTYEWRKSGDDTIIGTDSTLTITPTSAGAVTYTCTVTLDNYTKTASKTLNVPDPMPTDKITPPTARNLTYTAAEQALITAGSLSTDIAANYHMEYKLGTDGNWTTDVSSITAKDAGSYQVYYRVVRNSGNLNGNYGKYECPTPVSVSITFADNDSTYSIFVASTKNGSLSLSRSYAWEGSTVTINVLPDNGYTLESLTVIGRGGKVIQLTDMGGGKYTFTMPDRRVEITASFIEDNSTLNSFEDITADKYYYDAVMWAIRNGITSGIDENHFGPDLSCTRAQLITFLWRAAGCPVANYTMDFNDVGDSYYTEAVRWAASLGIVDGYGNGLFGSDDSITRQQMTTILYRFAIAMGMDVSLGEDTNILSYADALDIAEYAMDAFQWACGAGILQGSNGNLMPNDDCIRAQIVTMLYRLLGE